LPIPDFVKKTIRSSGGHGAPQSRFSEPPSVFSSENSGLGTQRKNPLRGTKLFALPYILQSDFAERARTRTEQAFLAGKSERVFVQKQELAPNNLKKTDTPGAIS